MTFITGSPIVRSVRVLVPSHFLGDLSETAAKLGVTLVPYDQHGAPGGDSAGSVALFRWWLTPAEGDHLVEAHPLEWIHSGSAGIDHILTPTFMKSGIALTNSAGVHASSIAEWVIASMLYQVKDLARMVEQQHERRWEKIERPELSGQRAVFLGGGHIAREIALRLRPFGVGSVVIRRTIGNDPAFDRSLMMEEGLGDLAAADWLLVTLPLTGETRNLVDRDLLARLPAGARIVNVSRGEVIVEEALLAALRERRLAGAILDVFREEPLPASHPFWSMPEVLLLPHTTWRSPQVRQKQIELFAGNLRRFVRKEPLVNVVDRERGY